MSDNAKSLRSGFAAIQAEGQGVWRLSIFHRSSLPDPEALRESVRSFLNTISASAPDAPVLCLTCETCFDREQMPDALAAFSPAVPDPENHLVAGICAVCFQRQDLKARVRHTFRQGMGVTLRTLAIYHLGHA